jgi:hypothetical protein
MMPLVQPPHYKQKGTIMTPPTVQKDTPAWVFFVWTSFTLSKTVRDNYEAQKLNNRVVDAKTEKILHEYGLRET